MKKPAGIIVAAVVLSLMTILGFLCTFVSSAAMFLNRYPIIPRSPGILMIAALVNVLLLCFLVFCAWTAVGLFRVHSRARIRMIIVGVLTAVFSGLIGAGFVHLYTLIPPGFMIPGQNIQVAEVALILALSYFVAALIGIWWIVYFSRPYVRQAFQPATPVSARL